MHSLPSIRKIALAAFMIAAGMVGMCRAANAAVTASLAIVGPNPVNAPCPVNVGFTGSINGSAGTVLTYSFNRFVNSVQQVVNGGTVTMPAGGSIAVNDSIPISSPTSGSTFDQIWVHNISGGQSDVYSNRVDFTATCGTPPPPKSVEPSPTNLHATTSPDECGKIHNGSWACVGILQNELLLVWDWTPSNATDSTHIHLRGVDGYRLYRVDGGRHDPLGSQAFPNITAWDVAKPSGGYNGACYAVSAYQGLSETPPSAPYCISPVTLIGLQHVSLQSVNWSSGWLEHTGGCAFWNVVCNLADLGSYVSWGGCQTVCVGFVYDSDSNRMITRGAYVFDVSSLAGHSINSATLSLRVSKSMVGTGHGGSPSVSCVTKVALANQDWWNRPNDQKFHAMSWDYEQLVTTNPPTATMDVTRLLNRRGTTFYGFVVSGDESRYHESDPERDSCYTEYSQNATLDVDYF